MIIGKGDNSRFDEFFEIPEDLQTLVSSYRIGEGLGVGGNAAVYECTNSLGNVCAVKFFLNFGRRITQRFKQEISILKQLHHPHIIQYIDEGIVFAISLKTRKEVDITFIIMEKADRNLVEYLKEQVDSVNYEIYAPQFRGLAGALSKLHEVAIHRDIKPENILVKDEKWMLSDFGLCEMIAEDERLDLTGEDERIGPKFWLSPEAANRAYWGEDNIDKSSDVYQLCAVFWLVITRRCPIGIIRVEDYAEYDFVMCAQILNSLQYNKNNRPQDGSALYDWICTATIYREVT
jgi:serine/threonine-protein kinase